MGISKTKKFLIVVLSLTLLFAVSCSNEDKTGGGNGDIDNQINALFNSIPALFSADATDAPNGTYTGDFTLTDLKNIGNYDGGGNDTPNISLDIKENKKLTLTSKNSDSSFRDAPIKTDNNGKYNAISEVSSEATGILQKFSYYIEFTKDNDTAIKDIKFIVVSSIKGETDGVKVNGGYQETYTCKTLTSSVN